MADELRYFLPEALKSALEHETAKLLKVSKETIEIDGFKIAGFALSGSLEELSAFITTATLDFGIHKINTLMNLQTLKPREHVMSTKGALVRLGVDPFVMYPEHLRSDWSKLAPLTDDMQKTLEWLSDYSGIQILFDVRGGGFASVYPRQDHMVHVVVGASPPGEVRKGKRASLCGIQFEPDGSAVAYENVESYGSGTIVFSKEKEPIAQIVGKSIFVFVPMEMRYARVLRDQDGLGLFKKALRYAWNAYVEDTETVSLQPIKNVREYTDLIEELVDCFPSIKRAMIENEEREARRLHAEYLSRMQYVQILKSDLREGVALLAEYDKKKCAAEFKTLRSNKLLKVVGILKGGLQVVTHPIVYQHEGKRYRLGTYVIRISKVGQVSVWAESTSHPSGCPHPHIGLSGNPCFGNISIAIDRAAIEHRIVDTIDLVLRWLTEGYDPKLADTPITEWPEEI